MKRAIIPWVLLSAGLLGCAPGAGPSSEQRPAPAKAVDERLVQANTRFGFNLFHTLRKEEAGKNLFISPASVSLALTLTYNGARGETQQAMAKALALEGLSVEEANRETGALQTILANPDPKVELNIANSIWYKKGLKINPAFLETSKTHYRAEVQPVEFGAPAAADTINSWVAKATGDKIKTVVQETKPLDRMYLINAIYFNGKWQRPFDPAQTRPLPFTRADGSAKEHPMMIQSGRYRYFQGENFQAAALPYGEGRLSMYVLLPDEGTGLEKFYESLSAENWESWLRQFAPKEGRITLPKVKLSYGAELSDPMKALGMGLAFQHGAADFGNLFEQNTEDLAIGFILHKTFLDMNEEGTEAAAVTVVGVTATSAPAPSSRFDMLVDRPYFIAIRDDQTGAILFMGSILNPQQ